VDDHAGGQFTLTIKELGNGKGAHIALKSRRDGRSVFFDALPLHNKMAYEDRVGLIGRSIISMQNHIREYYRKNRRLDNTNYQKYSKVYELVRKFDKSAIVLGLDILSDLESTADAASILFSFKASLLLQQKMFLIAPKEFEILLREALVLAEKSVELDPWQALNHRYLAFATCFSEKQEMGLRHMLRGHYLAPLDPLQTIATAEVCAFAGDIERAFSFSNEAFRFRDQLPRYSYGYLANIHFAAGDFEKAALFARQAPTESMDYRATHIASLWELGRKIEASHEMKKVVDTLMRQQETPDNFSIDAICRWLGDLSPFGDPKTRSIYRNAIRLAASGA